MVTRGRLAVIPARGGSKRLPRKNVLDFGGKPMLVWTIEAAQRSGAFDRIFVSTEDKEIARVAEAAGAPVPFLRDCHFDDRSAVSDVTLTVLRQIRETIGETFDKVVQLMPNCPLRDAQDVVNALAAFERARRTTQISCVRFGGLNPWWAHTLEGGAKPLFPAAMKSRSQDLPTLYCPSGAIWIANVEVLENHRTFYAPGYAFEPLSWDSGIDIDDADDLELARAALECRRSDRADV